MVRIERDTLKAPELGPAAVEVVKYHLDRMPQVISLQALSAEPEILAAATLRLFRGGYKPSVEVISMPKMKFGSRPVPIIGPPGLVGYQALADLFAPILPEPSRSSDSYRQYAEAGTSGGVGYIVEYDISACYEYIDHAILGHELIKQGGSPERVEALTGLLRDFQSRSCGLPQMVPASDSFADLYLSILQRALQRHGWQTSRFVDDFKTTVSEWATANQVLVRAVEYARTIGLVLSPDKSSIRRMDRVKRKLDREQAAQLKFLEQFSNGRQGEDLDPFSVESYPIFKDPHDSDSGSPSVGDFYWALLQDWFESATQARRTEVPLPADWRTPQLSRAVRILAERQEPLSQDLLGELIFHYPLHTPTVCRYIAERSGSERTDLLLGLAEGKDLTPWEKVWYLDTAARLDGERDTERVSIWARGFLRDRYEVVRAQASWLLATLDNLTDDDVLDVYRECTDVTTCGVSASAARSSKVSKRISESIAGESDLMKAASDWATRGR